MSIEGAKTRGSGFQAYGNQAAFYDQSLRYAQSRKPTSRQNEPLEVLDFGTGRYGASRMILQSLLATRGRLALFDPKLLIEAPRFPHVSVVGDEEVYGYHYPAYDLISISYVLCCLDDVNPAQTLLLLQHYHHQSLVTLIDYTMKGVPGERVLELLDSAEEKKWQTKDKQHFVEARTRHTPNSLHELSQHCGYDVVEQQSLDSQGHRTALLLVPRH